MGLGILYGISVGTGDCELITLKGLNRLQQVPIVAFPAGVSDRLGFAQQIVTPWLSPQQQLLPLSFPYTQDETTLQQAWKSAAQQVWEYLQQGQDIGFVCEGDTSFYSTFTYLAQTLSQEHPEVIIKTIPGVCSPMAVASVLGIPLTQQNQCLMVLPALYSLDKLEKTLEIADIIVLMKVSSVYEQVWQILQRANRLEQAWVVERATLSNQKIYRDLQDLPHLKLSYFSLMIVGKQ